MPFNTISFYAVFVAFLLIFALLRRSTRTGMLVYVVLFNLFFFYQANGLLCLLLPATAMLSWLGTRQLQKCQTQHFQQEATEEQKNDIPGNSKQPFANKKEKAWLVAIILIDLLPLLYFKYTNFGIGLLNDLLHQNFPLLKIALPIGISFYTFQALSHAIDVYRRRFTDRVTLLEYTFFLSFFPFLLAGPITRAGVFFPQIRANYKREVNERLLYAGLWLIIVGLLKKAVVADYIAQYNNWIFEDPLAYSGVENLMGVIGYGVQIYCDFSGYSDMSIGIAALLGIELIENFKFPYQSLNITEFWRRWHISLSTWFRDYLYIPLGGNRKGTFRTCLNSLFTMVIAGLWHGSTPMFILWGTLHGVGLVIHKICQKLFLHRIPNNGFTIPISWLIMQVFLLATWVFFRSPDMDTCMNIFSQIFTNFDLSYLPYFINARPLWLLLIVLVYLAHATSDKQSIRLQDWFVASHWTVKLVILIVVIQLAIEIESSNVQPFIYLQF